MDQEGASAAAGGAGPDPTSYEFWYRHWSRVYGTGSTDWRALYGNAAEEKWHEWSASDSDEMNRIYRQGKRVDRLAMYARDFVRLFGSIAGMTVVCVLVAVALIRLFLASTKYIPIP